MYPSPVIYIPRSSSHGEPLTRERGSKIEVNIFPKKIPRARSPFPRSRPLTRSSVFSSRRTKSNGQVRFCWRISLRRMNSVEEEESRYAVCACPFPYRFFSLSLFLTLYSFFLIRSLSLFNHQPDIFNNQFSRRNETMRVSVCVCVSAERLCDNARRWAFSHEASVVTERKNVFFSLAL